MPAPANNTELLDLIARSGVADDKRIAAYVEQLRARGQLPSEPVRLAELLIAEGLLTRFQAEQLLQGKWKRFTIGKYKVLERLGTGGMGSVYLCEHTLMRRRVAVKVLPASKAEDPAALERFYREARAVAALDHPNIVRAYDIDQDDKLHFLVMEHVDGASLQEIIKRSGPMNVIRACHYMHQAALGLQHAHEYAGIVHRDIKPGNILVDRNGIVKILDMGLARFFHDEDDILTRKYDENVLGTADYLAPEQALDSHTVDIRADIYSLGATFYFTLTGKPPFAEGTVAQKLMWHQTRQPKSIRQIRPEVPEGVAAIIEKMMAKDPAQRYQSPIELAEALAPWTQTPIDPPPEHEMPQLSRAAMLTGEATIVRQGPGSTGQPSPTPRKQWQVSGGSSSGREQTTNNSTPQPVTQPTPQPTTPVPTTPATPATPQQRRPASAVPAQTQRPVQTPATTPQQPVPAQQPTPAARRVPTPTTQPTPATNTTPATATAVEQKPEAEEEAGWDEMTEVDPAQRIPPLSSPSRRSPAATPFPVWLWVAVGVATVVVGVGLYLAFGTGGRKVPPATTTRTTIIDSQGTDGTTERKFYPVWRESRPGDRILVRHIEEGSLVLHVRTNLTIEVDPAYEHEAVWKGPKAYVDGRWPGLFDLRASASTEMENIVFRGITFDGANAADTLVIMMGRCPGVKFERCTFLNFKKEAVLISNCEGDKDRPVEFVDCTFRTGVKTACAIRFDRLPNQAYLKTNRFIRLKDLTIEGVDVKLRTKAGADFNEIDIQSAGLSITPDG